MAARRRDVPILRARAGRIDPSNSRPPPAAEEGAADGADADRVSSVPPRPSSLPPSSPAAARGRTGSAPTMNLGRAPSDALRPGWTDDLLVGDPRLDHQHKRFFLYALRLSIACEQDRGPDEIESALRFLREYAMAHFADEERSMREVSYPYLASHAEAHAKFIARLQALEADLASHLDKRALALDIAYMAATWFAEHVRQVDRLVARFLATADTE